MGRTGDGVEVRATSIRLTFSAGGKAHRETLKGADGKPIPPTAANERYARRLAVEIREQIKRGTFNLAEHFPDSKDIPAASSVAGQISAWLAAQRIEDSTRAGYETAARFWRDAPADTKGRKLGALPLTSLRTGHVLTAIASRPDISGKTVNNYVSVLRESIALAVTDGLLAENPVLAVPRAKHQKPPPDPLTRDELEAVIAESTTRNPPAVTNMIVTWLWTGLRTSEIFGLRWPNVDLASGTILIAEATVAGTHKDNTKTNVARLVKLNSRALAAVQAQRQHTQAADGFVFLDPRYGTPWTVERAFRRSYWTPVLRVRKIRYRSPYNCRHTYATQMLMAGMTPAFCARQLGHSVEMFLRTYTKWLDGTQNDLEMARLEAALSSQILPRKTTTGT